MKNKQREEKYILTAKGVMVLTPIDSELADSIWKELELHAYRRDYNAILINADGGEFIKVELEKKHKNGGKR